MFTHQFFDLLLNLTDEWQVQNVESDIKKQEIFIDISYVGVKAECPITAELYSLYDHAPKRKWRHLDTMQYKTYITCRLPRVKNKNGKVSTVVPPWASKHERHTYLFEHAIIDLLQATKNQTKTAQIMRCGFDVVNRVLYISTARGLSRRNLSELTFDHISIDEKSFKNGHSYVTVLSHPSSGCILNIEEGRTKESTRNILDKTLTIEQQQNIQTISMDMWKAYLTVCKEKLTNAQIVHDRFHLVKYLNKCIDQVRKREVKNNEELRNSRYAMLKNQANLTEKQRLKFEAIRAGNYKVSKAWEVRENFTAMFNKETKKENGFILFRRWVQDSLHKQIKEVDKVVKMFERHMAGVVNAMISSFSNAMAERLNGKIQEIKTIAKGYRTFENFKSAILFFHGGLDLYPLK